MSDNTPSPNPNPVFARSIIGGKKTAKLEARVSEDLKEELRRKWHDEGFSSESECLEMLVAVYLRGIDHIRSVQEERLTRVGRLSDIKASAPRSSVGGIIKKVIGPWSSDQVVKDAHD